MRSLRDNVLLTRRHAMRKKHSYVRHSRKKFLRGPLPEDSSEIVRDIQVYKNSSNQRQHIRIDLIFRYLMK